MHSIEIPQIRYKAEFPSCIEELTPSQYRYFIGLIRMFENGDITWIWFRVQLLNHFLQLKRSWRKLSPGQKQHINEEIFRLSETLDSFCEISHNEKGEEIRKLNLSFIKNPLPFYESFRGPADALTNCTFQQFIDAHHALCAYSDTQDPQTLDLLFAILYRYNRPGWLITKSDYPVYSDEELALSKKYVYQVADDVKFGVMLWFRACEEFLQHGEIPIGDSVINLSVLYGNGDGDVKDDTGLVGVMYTIAESGVFGPADKVATTNLYDVLIRIYQSIQLAKSLRK